MNTIFSTVSIFLKWIIILYFFLLNISCFAQIQRKERVDTLGIALKVEHKKYLYPTVDTLTTKELAVFVLYPQVEPNASLRLIERNGKAYIDTHILYKNISSEVILVLKNRNYKQLKLQSDCFTVEVSDVFKTKMLDAFRQTVNQKFVDLFPKKIEIYDGTNYNFWLNKGAKITSINIREDGDARYYGWKFAKINLQIIDDIRNGVFDESKYEL